ncbi:hypothetical protein PSEUBRA_002611 [Kalmanozyma brasiliensis GHG001]|uniref:ER membrane protein complex subunit 10 n=1 Tax=Kalmanozyma brasiliensis (strain GHG001) TaxID=1365824 RepID=V5EAY8_KALBG|nr:uncharacterized protein PSEUBRA_002611 [Kalmanozyma brasiliensis GHG001]EST07531.1 hypothetical protein PSEUBRA_002611 [Kalmanozyma brasiliensis GHG001]
MKLAPLSIVLGSALLLSTNPVAASTYTLLHRITPSTDWTPRATLELTNLTGTLQTTLDDAQIRSLHDQAWTANAGERYYQIALHEDGREVGYTSVKLCLLRQSHAELPSMDDEVVLTTRGMQVTGLGYRVRDIILGSDGCPVASDAKMALVREQRRKERQRQLSRRRSSTPPPPPPTNPTLALNTKLSVVKSAAVGKIALREAAKTNEDGTIHVPPPEKTFVQKYWYYAIPLVILLIMPDGGDERAQGAEGHASSEHRGTGMGAKQLK